MRSNYGSLCRYRKLKHCVFGHLALAFIWSCFVLCLHSRTHLSAWISMPGHQTLGLRCCLTLVMPRWPSCANWRMRGRSASGITIRLFPRIIPRFWQSSSFRSAKGFGVADQFPVSRASLMVFRVGSHSEERRSSWRVTAEGRESTIMELSYS